MRPQPTVAVAAIAWFTALFGSMIWDRVAGPGTVSLPLLGLSASLLGVLLLVAIMALPRIRSRFHNGFERPGAQGEPPEASAVGAHGTQVASPVSGRVSCRKSIEYPGGTFNEEVERRNR